MDIIDSFIKEIDDLYGTYLDSTMGYLMLKKHFMNKKPNPENRLFIGHGDPNNTESYTQHTVKFKDFFKRNSKNGNNISRIGNMLLVTIYQLWEDKYRLLISIENKVDMNEVQSGIFGDLRLIRHAIIHHNSKRTEKLDELSVIKFLDDRKIIKFSEGEIEIMIHSLKAELKYLKTIYNS